jgi:imidazolonepropionase-like amidohydrolase
MKRSHFSKQILTVLGVSLAALLLSAKAEAQQTAPAKYLVLQGGTLIDATGKPPMEDAVIVIEGARIKSVGKRGEVTIPNDSRIVDIKGKTVLPGFIDGHCHLSEYMGELYLHLGVTTCPDITLNTDAWTLAQRDGTNLGKIRGPRIWSTGERLQGQPPAWAMRAGTGFGVFVKTAEEARNIVRQKKAMGFDIIKLNEYVSPEVLRAAADEANKLGIPVTCHCLDVFLAADAGLAGVEHHWSIGMTSMLDPVKRMDTHQARMTEKIHFAELPHYYETENFDKIIQAMVAKNVSWSPTIATLYRTISPSAQIFKARSLAILDDPKAKDLAPVLRELATALDAEYQTFSPERLNLAKDGYSKIQEFMRRFVKAGGIIRAGSDPNNGMPALDMHMEMKMFVESGLTPMQALQAGTINVAKAFRKDKDFGTIEPGKVADITIIEGDPLKDIWVTQNVTMVIMNGEVKDIDFQSENKNPIPNPDPTWPFTPRAIDISPHSIAQGSESTVLKIKTGRGFLPYHKVSLNGNPLETRFVSGTELEAVVPAQAVKEAGIYMVMVAAPGEFVNRSSPAFLVVPFK